MTTFIPKLARITSGKDKSGKRVGAHGAAVSGGKPGGPSAGRGAATVNVEYLSGLVPLLRRRLALSRSFSDEALLASLVAVARHPSHEERWRTAETSTLGQHLASSCKDPRRALVTILSLLPKPYL